MFFSTQKTFDTETCTYRLHAEIFILHSFNILFCTQKLYPAQFLHSRNVSHRNLYAPKTNMHNNFYRQMVFTHRKFSAQKSYAQKVLRTTFFTLHTLLHMFFYTGTNCTQKLVHTARVYTANFYTERLCFPFLITYLSCSPSQVRLTESLPKIGGAAKAHRAEQTIATSRWFAGKPSVETGETQAG